MSKQTFYRYFPELEEHKMVVVSRKMGGAKLYRINLKHPLVNMLREYETKVSLQIAGREAEKMKKVPAIEGQHSSSISGFLNVFRIY